MNNTFRVILFMIIICSSLFLVRCSTLGSNPQVDIYNNGFLSFEPETVLKDMNSGKNNIFTPVISTPNIFNPTNLVNHWTQNDFDRISKYVHQQVWNETIDEWKLKEADFWVDCKNFDEGLQTARFNYFRINKIDNHDFRIEHSIYIDPTTKSIQWVELSFNGNMRGEEYFDISKMIVSADEAIPYAEVHGGRDARLKTKNNCGIKVYPMEDNKQFGWYVVYTSYANNNSNTIFEIWIK